MKSNTLHKVFLFGIFFLIATFSFSQSKVSFTFPTVDTTWVAPPCVSTVTVQVWGGGGGGGGGTGNNGGSGGGGGAFSSSVLNVTPGTSYNIKVGTPGQAGNNGSGTAGGDAWFSLTGAAPTSNATGVLARGGGGGNRAGGGTTAAGGAGGATTGFGTTKFAGGVGGTYRQNTADGGGGGGATAGPTIAGPAGSAATDNNGGLGGAGQNSFGNGGAGGSSNAVGTDNSYSAIAGGGGGSGTNGTTGGLGSPGMVSIILPPPLSTTVSNPQTICPGNAPAIFTTTATGGSGGAYIYTWQSSTTDSISGFSTIGGASASTYTSPSISTTTWYRSIVSATGCAVQDTADAVKVIVMNLSGEVSFPQTICSGNVPTQLTALPSPSNLPATYVWQSSTSGSTSGFSPSGGTAVTSAPGAVSAPIWYRVVISSPGCVTYTTVAIGITPSNAVASCNAAGPSTIYNTNTLPLVKSSVMGSATTGAWSILSSSPAGTHTLSSTAQTNHPELVTFKPQTGFTGTVVVRMTTNSNGCNVSTCDRTITVLPSAITTETYSTAGANTWTVPGCVNTITVQVWGAGGGGGGANASASDGGGGGGGAFSQSVINNVTQGTVYNYSVGAGGAASFTTRGEKGGNSWFGSPTTVMAQGGAGGLRNGAAGENGDPGVGGNAAAGYGQIKYSGGMGGQGGLWPGGGGGSSAGYTANGTQGKGIGNGWNDGAVNAATPGGVAPAGGGNGGNGAASNGGPGIGGNCTVYLSTPGSSPGGGGGGGVNACDYRGQPGAAGQLRILYGPSIPIFIVARSVTICQGESANLIASTEFPITFEWSNGLTSQAGVTDDTVTVTPATTTAYTISDPSGCANPVTVTVTVNPPPTVNITSSTVCAGTAGTVTASGGTSYSWNTGATTAAITQTPATTTIYTVTVSTANCAVVRTGTITVNGGASVTSTSATTCNGTSATITASGATTYSWNTGVNTAALTIANPTATTTYTVTGTLNGCSGTSTGRITVNPLPTATIGSSATVCRNTANPTITFTGANGTAPYTFTYTLNGGANQTITTVAGNSATLSAPTTTAGTYTYSLVRVQDANCTQNQTGTAIVVINPAPGADITGDVVLCNGSAAPNITFTGNSGTLPYTFTYKLNGGVNQTVSTTGGASTVAVVAPTGVNGTFTYSLIGVQDAAASACGAASGSATVTINPVPTATIGGSTTVCRNTASPNITFTGANGTAPYTFTYTLNGGANQTVSTTVGNSVTVSAPTTTAGTYTYSLVRVQDGNCSQNQTGTAIVVINPAPGADITGDVVLCNGSANPNIIFTGNSGTLPYTFTYKLNGGANQTVSTTGGSSVVTVSAPTTGNGTFTYSLTGVQDAAASACGAASGSATVTINPVPTATIGGSTTVCRNTASPNITFTGANGTAPYTFTYTLNGGANQTVSTTVGNSVTVSAPTTTAGTYTYSLVRVQDGNCSQNQTGTAIVVINPAPNATITGNNTVCLNSASPNITFTGSAGNPDYTFSYNLNGGATQTASTTGGSSIVTVAVPTTASGTFVYNLTGVQDAAVSACGAATGSVSITVEEPPTATAGGTGTICQTGTHTVSGASKQYGSVLWTHNGTGSIANATTLTPTYSAAAGDASNTVTLTMTVTSTNSCAPQTATANYTIVVDPLPTAVSPGSQTICENATATISTAAQTNGTPSWTENGSGSITAGGTSLSPTYTAASGDAGNSVILTMTITSTNACVGATAQSTYTINVDHLPTATAGGTKTICENRTATISGASQTYGSPVWTIVSGSGTLSNQGTLSPTYTAASGDAGTTVSLLMTVTSTNSCNALPATATANYSIIVDPLPTASSPGSQTICENMTATISTATQTNGAPSWAVTSGSGTLSNQASLTPTYTATSGDAGNSVILTMTITSTNSCNPQNATSTYTINVDHLPTATGGSGSPVCYDQPAVVSGMGLTNGIPTWTENGLGTLTNQTTQNPTYTPNISDAGNPILLTMTVTSNNTCSLSAAPTATATYTFSVRSLMTVTMDVIPSKGWVCQGDEAKLNFKVSNGSGQGPYQIGYNSPGGSSTASSVGNNQTIITDVNTDMPGINTFTLTSVSDAFCTQQISATATLTVLALPEATVIGGVGVCKGALSPEVTFIGSSANPPASPYKIDFTINGENASISTRVGQDSVNLTSPTDVEGSIIYTITQVTDANGCSQQISGQSTTMDVYVVPLADFTISTENTSILRPEVEVYDASAGGESWLWDFGDGSLSNLPDPLTHSYGDTGIYTISLLLTNGVCKDSTYQVVRIYQPKMLYVPSAFTPNGDNENEVFLPQGDGFTDYELMIFDRWGMLVFYSDDITKGWDGKANGGSEIAQQDVYIYVINIKAIQDKHDYTYRGPVSLVK